MNYHLQPSIPGVKQVSLWISDWEVRQIFAGSRCYYRTTNGYTMTEANGVFIREQRTREGTLGFVYRNPLNGQNRLWVISKKTRKPFDLAQVG